MYSLLKITVFGCALSVSAIGLSAGSAWACDPGSKAFCSCAGAATEWPDQYKKDCGNSCLPTEGPVNNCTKGTGTGTSTGSGTGSGSGTGTANCSLIVSNGGIAIDPVGNASQQWNVSVASIGNSLTVYAEPTGYILAPNVVPSKPLGLGQLVMSGWVNSTYSSNGTSYCHNSEPYCTIQFAGNYNSDGSGLYPNFITQIAAYAVYAYDGNGNPVGRCPLVQ
jgi:hypothetical protein